MNGLSTFIQQLGPTRLMAALGVTALAAALLFALVFRMGAEEKALLFSGVEMQEAAEMTARLEQANIEYELRGDGSSIFVPRSQVLTARMMLSAEGLPSRGSVGYEIFDTTEALGQTQFQQNINRLRALEGELARTIGSLDGVAGARVHLVMPERQLFERERQQPSASIVLALRRDALTAGQVRAVRNLVAGAVPGLAASQVTILDEEGRLLAAASDGESAVFEAGQEQQAAMEERLRRVVTDIVEGVVGIGNARVQVSTQMDFNRVEEVSQRFDPEGRVARTSSTVEDTTESFNGDGQAGSTAGANIPDGSSGGSGADGERSESTRTEENIAYEISSTTRTQVIEGGRLQRLSVAVAVDGVTTPGADGAEPTWAPRAAEDLAQLTTLVRSAVGFSEQRGDVVEVVSVRFDRPAVEAAPEAPGLLALQTSDLMRVIEVVAALIAALAIIFFVVRPLITGLVRGGGGAAGAGGMGAIVGPDGVALAGTGGALSGPVAAGLPDPSGGALPQGLEPSINIANIQGKVSASSAKQIAEVVQNHPDESAQIIRNWLNNAN